VSRDERYIIYDFTEEENGEHAERLLAGFKGVLLTDGAAEYNGVIKKGATRAGCSAHAFRYLEDARKDDPEQADAAIAIFKRLFEIEEIGAALSEEDRLALRQRQSKPLLADLRTWLDKQLETHLPKTALDKQSLT
jgi:transposase